MYKNSNAGIVYIGSIIQETEKIFTLLESTNASEEKSGKNGAKLCLAHGVLSCFSLKQLAGIKLSPISSIDKYHKHLVADFVVIDYEPKVVLSFNDKT